MEYLIKQMRCEGREKDLRSADAMLSSVLHARTQKPAGCDFKPN